ncbi:MAG: SAM-dependent methyltransferase [Smithellaceae bacterium]|nr:SAM-dependent methyltransferase [Smithellaceae bacterium]
MMAGEELTCYITSQIKLHGPVTFARFMDWCLYHEQWGYYRRDANKIGKEGDFYTAPSVHPIFGALLAKQLQEMCELMNEDQFHVLEFGAGGGRLAHDILEWAFDQAPVLYRRLRYTLVDYPGPRSADAEKILERHIRAGIVSLASPDQLQEISVRGCILSNELFDALPCHRAICREGRLREIYVGVNERGFCEFSADPSTPELEEYFANAGIVLTEGQQAEVNLAALEMMSTFSSLLSRGFIFTIDYGYRADELYAPARRDGSLRGYRGHQMTTDYFKHIGLQDLTAHINFTALIGEGELLGLPCAGMTSQSRFLLAMGLAQEMERSAAGLGQREALEMRLSIKHLIEPGYGMGEAMKVLIQYRGLERPALLGLRPLRELNWA